MGLKANDSYTHYQMLAALERIAELLRRIVELLEKRKGGE